MKVAKLFHNYCKTIENRKGKIKNVSKWIKMTKIEKCHVKKISCMENNHVCSYLPHYFLLFTVYGRYFFPFIACCCLKEMFWGKKPFCRGNPIKDPFTKNSLPCQQKYLKSWEAGPRAQSWQSCTCHSPCLHPLPCWMLPK